MHRVHDRGQRGADAPSPSRHSNHSSSPATLTSRTQKCDIIKKTDHNARGGIAAADDEKRNFCWMRVHEAAREASDVSSCEVSSTWPDGRTVKRECIVHAVEPGDGGKGRAR